MAAVTPADTLALALTRPAGLASATEVQEALNWQPGRERDCALALAAFDALLYSRPDLVTRPLLDRVLALVQTAELPERLAREAVTTLELLATTGLARPALAGVLDALGRGALGPHVLRSLPALLRTYAAWRLDLFDLEAAMATAERTQALLVREALLHHVIEPLAFQTPERCTPALVEALQRVFGGCARFPHLLRSLAWRAGTPVAVKGQISARLAGRLPRRALAATLLRRRPYALLVVVNARIGQGDELIEVVPLAQGLLDANPASVVTLLTRRTYLYDHPRARPLPIEDDQAAGRALETPLDAVLEVFDQNVPEFALNPGLERALDHRVAAARPRLVLKRDLIRNDFAFRVVAVRGRNMARRWRLDRQLFWNVYETGQRLLAEMGLPQRAGEEVPCGPSLLVGTRSLEAEACWERLTGRPARGGSRSDGRPVAVVNPFGGAEAIKGYLPRQAALLAQDLEALVREGYFVLLLSNGTPWAGAEVVGRALSGMAPTARRCVALAPDPAATEPSVAGLASERPELPHPDRVMRLLKYFASYADLIVTVEGWLGHLAYLLGRPFRLVLTPGSHLMEWLPHLRSPRQGLALRLLPVAADRTGTDLLGPDDPPPFPFPPRNLMLQTVLRGLGLAREDRLAVLLGRALASEDPGIRLAAVTGLGELPTVAAAKAQLVALLHDPAAPVRSAAAAALLGAKVDCRDELGPSYRDVLAAYVGMGRFDALGVPRRGRAALPAVMAAAADRGPWRRQWARAMLIRLLADVGIRGGPSSEADPPTAAGVATTGASEPSAGIPQ